MKAGSGVIVEDGPGAAVVSEELKFNLHKLSTGTPVIVSMRSGIFQIK